MIKTSAADAVETVRHVLHEQAKTQASLTVDRVDEYGLFPSASPLTPMVPPVVVDANWLRDDITRVCRSGRPTVFITCAANHFLRPFAAPHVMREVEKYAEEWSGQAGVPVAAFHEAWAQTYQQLLRVVEPSPALLTADERERITTLRSRDADDVPTATLAILLKAPLIGTDRHAVTAVYGGARPGRGRDHLLAVLSEGGTSGQLSQMSGAAAAGAWLAVAGVAGLGKVAARRPVAALLATGAIAVTGYATRDRWCEAVAAAGRELGQLSGAATAVGREARNALETETPPMEPWDEMSAKLSRRSVVARAAVYELARYGPSHLAAHELALRLPSALGGVGHTLVRGQMRALAPAMATEVFHGRWQLGRPWPETSPP